MDVLYVDQNKIHDVQTSKSWRQQLVEITIWHIHILMIEESPQLHKNKFSKELKIYSNMLSYITIGYNYEFARGNRLKLEVIIKI